METPNINEDPSDLLELRREIPHSLSLAGAWLRQTRLPGYIRCGKRLHSGVGWPMNLGVYQETSENVQGKTVGRLSPWAGTACGISAWSKLKLAMTISKELTDHELIDYEDFEEFIEEPVQFILNIRNKADGGIRGTHPTTQSVVTETGWCLLSIINSGVQGRCKSFIRGAVRFLKESHIEGTGWSLCRGDKTPQVYPTTVALRALMAADQGVLLETCAQQSLRWLQTTRPDGALDDAQGGWGQRSGDPSDPAHTSHVLDTLGEIRESRLSRDLVSQDVIKNAQSYLLGLTAEKWTARGVDYELFSRETKQKEPKHIEIFTLPWAIKSLLSSGVRLVQVGRSGSSPDLALLHALRKLIRNHQITDDPSFRGAFHVDDDDRTRPNIYATHDAVLALTEALKHWPFGVSTDIALQLLTEVRRRDSELAVLRKRFKGPTLESFETRHKGDAAVAE